MFSRKLITPSTQDCSAQLEQLKAALAQADAIIIGAGAGLSTSAGLTYSGRRFEQYFSDFAAKYGFSDMYSGGFYPYPTQAEYWAYWSRYININRYMDAPKPVYDQLLERMQGRDYFVITTNVDHCFQKAGFDKHRLFYTQGDYGLFQCSVPCRQETFDNEDIIREMVRRQSDMRIPPDLIPVCPHCGKPMAMNLRCDDTFVEDAGWHAAAARYADFLRKHKNMRVLFLELGVGYNTPGIIKYSFWHMVQDWRNATYACLNAGEASAPDAIRKKSICINGDVGEILMQL